MIECVYIIHAGIRWARLIIFYPDLPLTQVKYSKMTVFKYGYSSPKKLAMLQLA